MLTLTGTHASVVIIIIISISIIIIITAAASSADNPVTLEWDALTRWLGRLPMVVFLTAKGDHAL